MKYFSSPYDYQDFSHSVKSKFRFVRDERQDDFISAVLYHAENYVKTKSKDEVFFRSQIGNVERPMYSSGDKETDECLPLNEFPFSSERMMPHERLMVENRANPPGIPHLYCASDIDTAIAESRPWCGCSISVAEVHLLKDLKFVNCCPESLGYVKPLGKQLRDMEVEQYSKFVWDDICLAFSIRVDRNDCHLDYISTQVLSEEFKKSEYDGVIYKSNLGKGFNIVVFDLNNIKIGKRDLYEIKSVNFQKKIINTAEEDEM